MDDVAGRRETAMAIYARLGRLLLAKGGLLATLGPANIPERRSLSEPSLSYLSSTAAEGC